VRVGGRLILAADNVQRIKFMTQTAAEKYRQQLNGNKAEIVDVTVPSGFVFKFEKPRKFQMLFEYGNLPQTAANGAVQSWIDQGVLKPGDIDEDTAQQIDDGIRLRDRVLALSRPPTKLVVGDPGPDEIDARLLSDEDAAYLFAWVQSGGDESLALKSFPVRPEQSAVGEHDGPSIRAKAKRASRHK
jgi:hypothetical protein